MREYIAERLAGMKCPEERAILRDVLNDVFLPLYDETEAKYAALEQRVRDEVPLLYDIYTVYSTILPRERVDSKHAYLSAIFPIEVEDPILSARDLADELTGGGHPVIETVFIEADHLKCQQVTRDKRILNGAFLIKGERYSFKCRLEPASRYIERIEVLYNTFLRNDVPWTTVNCAYLNKFFDVRLVELVRPLPKGSKIHSTQIEISYGPYDGFVRYGLVPVWNIDYYHVKGEEFPMPAIDSVNYEYHFDTKQLGNDCGYLMDYDNSFVLSTRRENNILVVVSPKSKELSWDMYRFRRKQDTDVDTYPYPVLSNARKDSFSTRLMNKYGTHITTKAEMRKLLLSFDVSDSVELVDFHFAGDRLSGDTYDMNPYIRDEVRDPAFQKTLALTFKAKKRDNFLARDILSFLVSEFQATYPEYRCVGTLV